MNGLVVRSRCDSETTLLNNDQEVEEEKGQETVDKGGDELGGRDTEMVVDLDKLREILLENARDSNVEGGERFFCLGKTCHERESSKVRQVGSDEYRLYSAPRLTWTKVENRLLNSKKNSRFSDSNT